VAGLAGGYGLRVEFRPEQANREAVAKAFDEHRAVIEALLPAAEVEHIGSTAVPGALTKGDLDLLVRVPEGRFDSAHAALRNRYAVDQPQKWTSRFASFKQEPAGEIPVGVQLVVAGGTDDALFVAWRDRLRADPDLLERFNAFKRGQVGADPDDYIEAKAQFIEAVIGDGLGKD
jgi:GrpB-like predicted nucleotidyltransferase (UPF0157 family)